MLRVAAWNAGHVAVWSNNYLIFIPIGDHSEEDYRVSLGCSFGYEHVVRPAAAAEVELCGLRAARATRTCRLVAECTLVGDSYWRFNTPTTDCVCARIHWNLHHVLRNMFTMIFVKNHNILISLNIPIEVFVDKVLLCKTILDCKIKL